MNNSVKMFIFDMLNKKNNVITIQSINILLVIFFEIFVFCNDFERWVALSFTCFFYFSSSCASEEKYDKIILKDISNGLFSSIVCFFYFFSHFIVTF